MHDDVIKWKHFLRYLPFVLGIHRWPVNSPQKGQWCGALVLSLICAWINGWVNNGEADDLKRHHAHYDITVVERVQAYPIHNITNRTLPGTVSIDITPSIPKVNEVIAGTIELITIVDKGQCILLLAHFPLVPHLCVSESGEYWFRQWLVAYSVPSHYLRQCRVIVNWILMNKLQRKFNKKYTTFHSRKYIRNYRLRNGGLFVQGEMS